MSSGKESARYWIDENGFIQNSDLDPRTSTQKITRSDFQSRSSQTPGQKPDKSLENSRTQETESPRSGISAHKDNTQTHLSKHRPQGRPAINPALIRSPQELKPRRERRPEPVEVPCPICSIRFERARINEHCLKVHGKEFAKAAYGKTKTNKRKAKKKRTTPANNANAKSGARLSPAGHPMTRCQFCNVEVRADRLQKHYKKVHLNKRISKPAKKVRRGTSGYDHRVDNDRYRKFQQQSEGEFNDGSTHWGHMRRENGRFGSFPGFDDYSEESMP